jgi:hypothetical protein
LPYGQFFFIRLSLFSRIFVFFEMVDCPGIISLDNGCGFVEEYYECNSKISVGGTWILEFGHSAVLLGIVEYSLRCSAPTDLARNFV